MPWIGDVVHAEGEEDGLGKREINISVSERDSDFRGREESGVKGETDRLREEGRARASFLGFLLVRTGSKLIIFWIIV